MYTRAGIHLTYGVDNTIDAQSFSPPPHSADTSAGARGTSLSYSDAVDISTAYEIVVDGVPEGVLVDVLVARVRDLDLDPEHIAAITDALEPLDQMARSVYERVSAAVAERYRLRA
jgi:hypothetical protein